MINKIGKIGKANIKARKKIAEIAEDLNLNYCEVRFKGCMGTFGIAPAHKRKRVHYKGDWEKLADYKQWVVACQYCHQKMEEDSDLTNKVFKELRP